jgi:hypothetical protein
MQKDESCDACERLLPCGPARGDVQYLILCKGKHTTHAHAHARGVRPCFTAHPVDTTRLGAGVAVRTPRGEQRSASKHRPHPDRDL